MDIVTLDSIINEGSSSYSEEEEEEEERRARNDSSNRHSSKHMPPIVSFLMSDAEQLLTGALIAYSRTLNSQKYLFAVPNITKGKESTSSTGSGGVGSNSSGKSTSPSLVHGAVTDMHNIIGVNQLV